MSHEKKNSDKEDKVIVEALRSKINERLKNKETVKKAAQIISDLINTNAVNKK